MEGPQRNSESDKLLDRGEVASVVHSEKVSLIRFGHLTDFLLTLSYILLDAKEKKTAKEKNLINLHATYHNIGSEVFDAV